MTEASRRVPATTPRVMDPRVRIAGGAAADADLAAAGPARVVSGA